MKLENPTSKTDIVKILLSFKRYNNFAVIQDKSRQFGNKSEMKLQIFN